MKDGYYISVMKDYFLLLEKCIYVYNEMWL